MQEPSAWGTLRAPGVWKPLLPEAVPGFLTEKYFVAIAILFHSSNLRAWPPFRLPLAASALAGAGLGAGT